MSPDSPTTRAYVAPRLAKADQQIKAMVVSCQSGPSADELTEDPASDPDPVTEGEPTRGLVEFLNDQAWVVCRDTGPPSERIVDLEEAASKILAFLATASSPTPAVTESALGIVNLGSPYESWVRDFRETMGREPTDADKAQLVAAWHQPASDPALLDALREFDAWLSFRGEFAEVLTAFRKAFGAALDLSTPEPTRAEAARIADGCDCDRVESSDVADHMAAGCSAFASPDPTATQAEAREKCARDSGWCDGHICHDYGINCPSAEPRTPVGWTGDVTDDDGKVVGAYHAHGDEEPSEETRAALAEVVRAAYKKMTEDAPASPQPPEEGGRWEPCLCPNCRPASDTPPPTEEPA